MNYDLFLTGFVGGPDFDERYIAYILQQKKDEQVNVFINSLGGQVATGLAVHSLFRSHGNVHVTLAGLNASAATIAALGAKDIQMERSSLFLVHRASLEFFDWASRNADEIKEHAEELLKTASELEKVDFAIAQLYADKTETSIEAMIDLMNTAEWLTADMCLDYGFVDGIIENSASTEQVINNFDFYTGVLNSASLPVPQFAETKESFIQKIVHAIREAFTGNSQLANHNSQPAGEDSPSKDIPSDDVPSDDSPSEDSPSEDSPSEDSPSEDSPNEDVPIDKYDDMPETGTVFSNAGETYLDTYARALEMYNALP